MKETVEGSSEGMDGNRHTYTPTVRSQTAQTAPLLP